MVFASDIDLELYPVSDGKPMADSSLHYRWIVTIKENLEVLFANDPMVVVEADTFWYPVPQSKDKPIRRAPDVMVIFGRPKGDSPSETQSERGSYIQHEEGNIAPQVVFEIYSPSNDTEGSDAKFEFYQRYGVEEYYCFYPEDNILEVWLRMGADLRRADWRDVWVSPRLGITFDLTGEVLRLYDPNGNAFTSFGEERQEKERERREKERERQQRKYAEERAEQAEAIAERERQEKELERQRRERAEAMLRELGIDPNEL